MNTEETILFENGSRWVRADFHLHTQADRQFAKVPAEIRFEEVYAEALAASGVGVGVITNHNKFDQDEFKLLRKKALKTGVFLLPGVELSVQGGATGIHMLVVFDPATWIDNRENEKWIEKFLDRAFDQISNRESEDTACKWTLFQLLQDLANCAEHGRDSFVIAAHVDRSKGLLKELGAGVKSHYGDLFRRFVLGFQRAESGGGWRHLGQWFGDEWRPARVEGSDCKALDQIGRAHQEGGKDQLCWLKLGDFNFAAVRLSLVMKEHRVSAEPPPPTGTRLVRVRFIGGLMDGRVLPFSGDLNNFIGIRGSGKSSVLECIRYALDYRLRGEPEDLPYKEELVKRTLTSGGKVLVDVVTAEGRRYRIERVYGESPKVYRDDVLVPGLRPDGVLKFRYFGQKDLAKFSNKQFASELVDRFTSASNEADDEAIAIANRVEQRLVALSQDEQRLTDFDETSAKLAEINETLRKFDDAVREKLNAQTALERDINIGGDLLAHEQDALAALQSWSEDYGDAADRLIKVAGAPENPFTVKVVESFKHFRQEYAQVKPVLAALERRKQETEAALAELKKHYATEQEAFAEVRRDLQLPGQLTADTYVELTKQRNLLEAKQVYLNSLKGKRDAALQALAVDLDALQQVWHNAFQTMAAEVRRLNEGSPGLMIKLEFKGNKDAFIERLTGAVKGVQRKTIEKITDAFNDPIEIYRDLKGDATRLADEVGLSAEQITRLRDGFVSHLKDILVWRVPDAVAIDYQGKPLHEHSIGQRATALMLFLLSRHEFDVLIVDQPEDDLDNQTLYTDVILRLLEIKGERQMIFATHNPNIPVLGDADQIFRCHYASSGIEVLDGSIDSPSVQAEVVAVMEGGEDALRKRNQIYSSWTR